MRKFWFAGDNLFLFRQRTSKHSLCSSKKPGTSSEKRNSWKESGQEFLLKKTILRGGYSTCGRCWARMRSDASTSRPSRSVAIGLLAWCRNKTKAQSPQRQSLRHLILRRLVRVPTIGEGYGRGRSQLLLSWQDRKSTRLNS